jgi:SEC-C motif-containing protein
MASTPAALPKPQPGTPCPCGSGKLFEACCEPILKDLRRPATAEELMRSRFTAHVAQDHAYLHRTYAATRRLPLPKEEEGQAMQWTRLVVHAHEPGRSPDHAFVDFSAFFVDETGEHAIDEKSEFHREGDQWLYTRSVRNGPAPLKSTTPKVGRNDPCPCGSGKKYKHCCLAKA